MRIFFSLFLMVLPLFLWAQRSGNPQRTYLSGKDFYNSGRYPLAAETFKSLTTFSNPYAEYASFYYGLSTYHQSQSEIAKNILLQLTRKYPDWSNNKEAYFWLGKIYFEKGDFALGLEQLGRIKDPSMRSDVAALKLHHLQEASTDELEQLHVRYPEDPEVAESLAIALGKQPLSQDQMNQLHDIIEQFNLSEEEISNQYVGPTVKKDRYKVAVCFPFLVNDINKEKRSNSNQWVLDLYQGIQLAHRDLRHENIKIDLFAYDTERDSLKAAGLFSLEEMKSMDLIIGPLYPGPSELVSAFAFNHRINMLNPLSSNPDIISNNPYSFLFHPGDHTQARIAANYMKNNLDQEKKVLIIYGSREGDSIAAWQYREVLIEAGIEVITMDQIPTVDSEEVAKFVSDNLYEIFTPDPDNPILMVEKEDDEDEEDDKDGFIPGSDIGHVFVASSNELIVANVIGTIDNMGPRLTIMGNDNWLQSRYVDFKQLERLNVHLAAPSFVDYSSVAFKEFHRRYIRAFKSIPNKYSFIGYDLMLLFGKFLDQGGTYFQHELRENEFYPGVIFTGYSYKEGNDNSYVPIVRFENGVLTQINK